MKQISGDFIVAIFTFTDLNASISWNNFFYAARRSRFESYVKYKYLQLILMNLVSLT